MGHYGHEEAAEVIDEAVGEQERGDGGSGEGAGSQDVECEYLWANWPPGIGQAAFYDDSRQADVEEQGG